MKKQIALAYGIAGIAVAVAIIAVVDTKTTTFEPGTGRVAAEKEPSSQEGDRAAKESASPERRRRDSIAQPQPQTRFASPRSRQSPRGETTAATGEPPVEVVYVDEPASPRRGRRYEERDDDDDERWEHHHDDDDDHEDHEEHEEDDDE